MFVVLVFVVFLIRCLCFCFCFCLQVHLMHEKNMKALQTVLVGQQRQQQQHQLVCSNRSGIGIHILWGGSDVGVGDSAFLSAVFAGGGAFSLSMFDTLLRS